MEKIYLDNASTTFPKPPAVAQAMYRYMTEMGSNVNRGSYGEAYAAEEILYDTRSLLCELFNGGDPRNVIFTKNITESLNVILKGFLKAGDHVLVSAMEHNAVMRPLVQLEETGVSFTRVPCDIHGALKMEAMEKCLRKNTVAVVMLHASNVCGTVMPAQKVGDFCKKHGLVFILDTAQSAGVIPVDMEAMAIDALAFTGHKGLMGPQGIGGFLLKEEMVTRLTPLLSGGTGSVSHTEEIPAFMPDRFEPGTPNIPGIVGLHAGLTWIGERGMASIRDHEMTLTRSFLEGLKPMARDNQIKIIGMTTTEERMGVVSLQIPGMDLAQAAYILDQDYGIMTRVGLHCAPAAHKTLNTYPEGTLRFSFGPYNTQEHVSAALKALEEIHRGI